MSWPSPIFCREYPPTLPGLAFSYMNDEIIEAEWNVGRKISIGLSVGTAAATIYCIWERYYWVAAGLGTVSAFSLVGYCLGSIAVKTFLNSTQAGYHPLKDNPNNLV